jgi:hypothetical protein
VIAHFDLLLQRDLGQQRMPEIVTMVDQPLALAYPKQRRDIRFWAGRFSPDGAAFAFSINNVTHGDPEQVWLYDLKSQRLVRITGEQSLSLSISDFVWSNDNVLYVRVENTQRYRTSFLAATLSTVNEVARPPELVADTLERRRHYQPSVGGGYTIEAEPRGHGFFALTMRQAGDKQPQIITLGSWGLATFIFDTARLKVIYPAPDRSDIVTFDLRNRQSRHLILPVGGELMLLDRRRDRTLIAYSVSGPCLPDESGRESHAGAGADQHSLITRHVCFVRPQ